MKFTKNTSKNASGKKRNFFTLVKNTSGLEFKFVKTLVFALVQTLVHKH